MARQRGLFRSDLPPYLQNKGYIREQRRIYERIDGKFVGIGYKLKMSKIGNRSIVEVYFVSDDELRF